MRYRGGSVPWRVGPRSIALAALAMVVVAISSCVPTNPPATPASAGLRFPAYPMPEIPASLQVDVRVRAAHEEGWARFQAGDLRRARSAVQDALKRSPTFYPGLTALGFIELASKHPKPAAELFSGVLARAERYLPAWIGQAEASLALGHDAEAVAAMERVLALDPKRDAIRGRLELVRLRLVQSLIETGRQARAAGQFDRARQALQDALSRSPASTLILHELVHVERAAGHVQDAETYARKALQLDPKDADAHALLAELLAERGQLTDAAAAYDRAAGLEEREEWRKASAELKAKARAAALPAEFANVVRANAVTRGQVAAFIGIKLESVIARAPARPVDIATDVRRHWAAPWIVRVTRAGVMSVFPNHTFQPGAVMSRASLASVISELLRLGVSRVADVAKWQAARPRFPDLPASHVGYRAAAFAVASGAMTTNARGELEPTRPASGADLDAAVRRIESLASR
jgi:tetratricopeptide (TPR) repeat protein